MDDRGDQEELAEVEHAALALEPPVVEPVVRVLPATSAPSYRTRPYRRPLVFRSASSSSKLRPQLPAAPTQNNTSPASAAKLTSWSSRCHWRCGSEEEEEEVTEAAVDAKPRSTARISMPGASSSACFAVEPYI